MTVALTARAIYAMNTLRKISASVFFIKRTGGALARQLGVDEARGVYSIHADGDDWAESQMLEKMYDKITVSNADIVIADFYYDLCKKMDLYLYTCNRQKMVDFLYFTDCGIPKEIYPNTKFYETDHTTYCKRVSDVLGINFNSKHGAYKLYGCKPFYGIIHEDELKGYDYWGFADMV